MFTFSTTLLTIINRGVLVNDISFITKIKTSNHFLKNHALLKYNIFYETDRVLS